MNTNDKLIKLRSLMALHGLDAFVIFSEDPHGSEIPAEHWRFREYISGFNGSAGTIVVTRNHAGLWTDSRYFIQAEKQLRGSSIELHKMGVPGVPDYVSYLTYLLPSGSKVGLDGFTISISSYRHLFRTLANFDIELDCRYDFADDLFAARPPLPTADVRLVEKAYEGLTRQEKIKAVRQKMAERDATHYLVASLDDIAWLTNMRGSDVAYNPVFYAYMIITPDEEHLYIDPHKLTSTVSKQLEEDGLKVSLYEHYKRNLGNIPEGSRVYYDPKRANACNVLALSKGCIKLEGPSLISQIKACKTDFEMRNITNAHVRDGVALVKAMRWIEENIGQTRVTEMDVAAKIGEMRAQDSHYISESFEPIVAYADHAAIVHYTPTIETNAALERSGLLLMDTGAQYVDGTTDITRTVALGDISAEEMMHYTLVLKGHIALATAIFPEGTKGIQLDTFARQNMWRYGIDYGHGTGHGVGYCLNVHEGPQSISKRDEGVAMELGMLTSNEPGIYVEDSHGIRIESLTVCSLAKKTEFGNFYGFKTVTLFPIDLKPVVRDMLTPLEVKWINAYHERVLSTLSPYLEGADLEWLQKACSGV